MTRPSIFGGLLGVLVIATLAFVFLNADRTEPAIGQATLHWEPPLEREDGTALDAVGGYRIYYGRDPGNLEYSIEVDGDVTEYRVGELEQGDWYFAVAAVSEEGLESTPSSVVKKTVERPPQSRTASRPR